MVVVTISSPSLLILARLREISSATANCSEAALAICWFIPWMLATEVAMLINDAPVCSPCSTVDCAILLDHPLLGGLARLRLQTLTIPADLGGRLLGAVGQVRTSSATTEATDLVASPSASDCRIQRQQVGLLCNTGMTSITLPIASLSRSND